MSYLCGGGFIDIFQGGARHLTPAVAPSQCETGTVSLTGNCTSQMPPFDLPRGLQQTMSVAALGPALADRLVPNFTVSLTHALSPEFEYVEALRRENGNFRIVNWNPLSLDANCCKLYNPNLLCIYGQEVSPADLQQMIALLVEVNSNLRNPPLIVSFRSRSGLTHQAILTA
jgi:hypothetical protein